MPTSKPTRPGDPALACLEASAPGRAPPPRRQPPFARLDLLRQKGSGRALLCDCWVLSSSLGTSVPALDVGESHGRAALSGTDGGIALSNSSRLSPPLVLALGIEGFSSEPALPPASPITDGIDLRPVVTTCLTIMFLTSKGFDRPSPSLKASPVLPGPWRPLPSRPAAGASVPRTWAAWWAWEGADQRCPCGPRVTRTLPCSPAPGACCSSVPMGEVRPDLETTHMSSLPLRTSLSVLIYLTVWVSLGALSGVKGPDVKDHTPVLRLWPKASERRQIH